MRRLFLLFMIVVLAWFGTVIADREALSRELISVQILSDTDDQQAQRQKLEVRDAVMKYLEADMADIPDNSEARQYLLTNLSGIDGITNSLLEESGSHLLTRVSFTQEAFPEQKSGQYFIPSGVYDTLRIVLGKGQGEYCRAVIFPGQSSSAGFSGELNEALSGSGEKLRFHILNILGKIENFFFCL